MLTMEMKAATLSMASPHRARFGTISSSATGPANLANPSDCAACHKPIKDKYLLKAIDQLFHEDCLRCACCDARLAEVGNSLYFKAQLILCKRDYLRLFGTTGVCSACNRCIPAFEMAMKLNGGRVYHLDCFQCSQCNHRFCVGDRFHMHENRILCEYDFEELSVYGSSTPNYSSNHIEKLKKQTESLASNSSPPPIVNLNDDGSSGYGSPDSLTLSDSK